MHLYKLICRHTIDRPKLIPEGSDNVLVTIRDKSTGYRVEASSLHSYVNICNSTDVNKLRSLNVILVPSTKAEVGIKEPATHNSSRIRRPPVYYTRSSFKAFAVKRLSKTILKGIPSRVKLTTLVKTEFNLVSFQLKLLACKSLGVNHIRKTIKLTTKGKSSKLLLSRAEKNIVFNSRANQAIDRSSHIGSFRLLGKTRHSRAVNRLHCIDNTVRGTTKANKGFVPTATFSHAYSPKGFPIGHITVDTRNIVVTSRHKRSTISSPVNHLTKVEVHRVCKVNQVIKSLDVDIPITILFNSVLNSSVGSQTTKKLVKLLSACTLLKTLKVFPNYRHYIVNLTRCFSSLCFSTYTHKGTRGFSDLSSTSNVNLTFLFDIEPNTVTVLTRTTGVIRHYIFRKDTASLRPRSDNMKNTLTSRSSPKTICCNTINIFSTNRRSWD